MSRFDSSALRALVPEASIDFLVGRLHVREPIADLQDDLLPRFEAACSSSPQLDGATDAQRMRLVRMCVAYATKRHLDNRVAYITIMSQCSRSWAKRVARSWP